MRTIYRHLNIIAVVLIGFIAGHAHALTHTVNFEINQLDTTIKTVDGIQYLRLEYTGLYASGEAGTPELPVRYVRFSVPYNTSGFTVSATPAGTVSNEYDLPVYPNQAPIPANSGAESAGFTAPDSVIYGSGQFFPSTLAEVVDDGFLGGDNHIVTVAVYPVSYSPLTGQIKFHSSISINLNYTTQNTFGCGLRPIITNKIASARQSDISMVKRIVVNPTQADIFAPSLTQMWTVDTPIELPTYEYCVVTSRELAPAFERLIGWKRQKGYSAGVVCIEDILASPYFQAGDTVSNINDDAGKLRAYLRYAYKNKVLKYALLAGDHTVLPVRYGTGGSNTPIPTDLYFSDFNGNWNVDNDLNYGERFDDNVDYYPEIYVGRLLCKTSQEVKNYTEKLFKYERNPGNGDFGYLKKAFYSQCDQMLDNHEANTIKAAWGATFSLSTIFSELPSHDDPAPTFPTGTDVVNEMNNRYGFFSWHGHGSPAGISVKCNKVEGGDTYGIVSFDGVLDNHSENYWIVVEDGHGLDNLTNKDYPAIAYSMSCTVTPFDIYTSPDTTYNVKYNIGSSFTVAGDYGGPAFLGNTREGWIGPSVLLEKEFVKQINSGQYQVGVAEALSRAEWKLNRPIYDHWCKLAHNLIGCPEFEMWTDIPTIYNDITVQRTDNGITVSGGDLAGSKVAVTSGTNRLPKITEATAASVTLTGVSPNSAVTVYRHNAIPYIAPLIWQNDTISESQYLMVSDVSIGEEVDGDRSTGNLVLSEGTITIEASGSVHINDGTVIKDNADITIKSQGVVTIKGCLIKDGGRLTIEGPGLAVITGGTIASGGSLTINREVMIWDDFEVHNEGSLILKSKRLNQSWE